MKPGRRLCVLLHGGQAWLVRAPPQDPPPCCVSRCCVSCSPQLTVPRLLYVTMQGGFIWAGRAGGGGGVCGRHCPLAVIDFPSTVISCPRRCSVHWLHARATSGGGVTAHLFKQLCAGRLSLSVHCDLHACKRNPSSAGPHVTPFSSSSYLMC